MQWDGVVQVWLGSYCSICVSIHGVPLDRSWSKCSRTTSSDWCLSLTNVLQVTSVDLHRHFHLLGSGTIEDVRVQRDKGFGFVRYSTHAEAALAIQMGNARIVCGKPIKVYSYDGFFYWCGIFVFPFWISSFDYYRMSMLVFCDLHRMAFCCPFSFIQLFSGKKVSYVAKRGLLKAALVAVMQTCVLSLMSKWSNRRMVSRCCSVHGVASPLYQGQALPLFPHQLPDICQACQLLTWQPTSSRWHWANMVHQPLCIHRVIMPSGRQSWEWVLSEPARQFMMAGSRMRRQRSS